MIRILLIFFGFFLENTLNAALFENWQEKSFEGKTQYSDVEIKSKKCKLAKANKSASGLFLNRTIDLEKNASLSWSWMAMKEPEVISHRAKKGDDFVLRLYVVHRPSSIFIWKTLALNYVFTTKEEKGSHWDNPFTSNAKMIVVNGSESRLNHWYEINRNIKNDFKKYFNKEIKEVHSIAIMTDTDNSSSSASGCYSSIRFF